MFLNEKPISVEESNSRKKHAEELVAQRGHRITEWKEIVNEKDNNFHFLDGRCSNDGCQDKMQIVPTVLGIMFGGAYSFQKCPYVRH